MLFCSLQPHLALCVPYSGRFWAVEQAGKDKTGDSNLGGNVSFDTWWSSSIFLWIEA